MAVLAVAAVGSAAFSAAGIAWFGMTAAATGWTVGSLIGGYLFRPDIPDVNNVGPRLDDLRVTTSSYGVARPFGYGTYPVAGNIIASSDIRESSHTDIQRSGGKGGGGQKTKTTTYSYSADIALGLGYGVIGDVLLIYANETLIYDAESSGTTFADYFSMKIYKGDETQEPDPTLQSIFGTATPGYRGEAYIVFVDLQLASFGNSIPAFRVVVAKNVQDIADTSATDEKSYLCETNYTANEVFMTKGDTGLIYVAYGSGADGYHDKLMCAVDPVTMEKKFVVGQTNDKPGTGNLRNCQYIHYCHMNFGTSLVPKYKPVIAAKMNDSTYSYIAIINPYNGSYYGFIITTGYQAYAYYSLYNRRVALSSRGGANIYISGYNNLWEINNYPINVSYPLDCGLPNTVKKMDSAGAIIMGARNPSGVPTSYGVSWVSDPGGYMYEAYLPRVYNIQGLTYDSRRDLVWAAQYDTDTTHQYLSAFDMDGNLVHDLNLTVDYGMPAGERLFDGVSYGGNESDIAYYDEVTSIILYPGRIPQYATDSKRWMFDTIKLELTSFIMLGREEYRDMIYDGTLNKAFAIDIVTYQSAWWVALRYKKIHQIESLPESLDVVVSDICLRAGYDASEIDVTDLAGINVEGYRIARLGTAYDLLQPLTASYFFDVIDDGNKLTFTRHGQGTPVGIYENELGCAAEGDVNNKVTINKASREELPSCVSVTYMDRDKFYENNTQLVYRRISSHKNLQDVQLALAFTANEAKRIADSILHVVNVESEVYTIHLPPHYISIRCGDIVTFTSENVTYVGRVVNTTYESGFVTVKAVKYDSTVRTSTATGGSALPGTSVMQVSTSTALVMMDLPAINSVTANPGLVFASGSYGANWPGGLLYRAATDDDPKQIDNLVHSTFGMVVTVPTQVSHSVWDTTNILTVNMISGTLESITETQTCNNLNVAAWGKDGRWEIVAFQNAVLQADGSYQVSKMIRGLRFTTEWMDTHDVNDYFVLLTGSIGWHQMENSEIGTAYDFIGVTYGKFLNSPDNEVVTATSQGLGIKPVKPIIKAGIMYTNYWLGYFFKTSRFTAPMLKAPTVSDNDYEADIWYNGSLVRTITSTASPNGTKIYINSPQYIMYDETDMANDGIPLDGQFYVYLYQLSSIIPGWRSSPDILLSMRTW